MYELAKRSGISRSQIIKVEKMDFSDCNIRLKTLIDIAEGMNVSLLDVLGIEHPDVVKRIKVLDRKKITILKKIAKDLEVNIKVEDE